MTREQTASILAVLKIAYPNFYKNMSTTEVNNTIDLWTEMFKNDSAETVIRAVKHLIATIKYVPTIADVKECIYKLNYKPTEKSLTEYWDEAFKMISNGLYMTQEEFDKHSNVVKKFFGNVNQLKQLAMVDMETVNTVVKGQFLKQAETLIAREKEFTITSLPDMIKNNSERIAGVKIEQ